MTPERLRILIDKYLQDAASPEEELELNDWYHAGNQRDVHWPVTHNDEASELKARMLQKLQQARQPASATRTIPFYRKAAWQAAAMILIILGAGTYVFWSQQSNNTHTAQRPVIHQPVVPGGDKAILTLADGRTIVLDTAANGQIAKEGELSVTKQEGAIVYDMRQQLPTEGAAGKATAYNMVSTPRGGQYKIVLPDGSKVWLNAASSLRFPTVFDNHERRVELTGEGYFEVSPLPASPGAGGEKGKTPFIVNVDGKAEVVVLGTHFNINAYHDESGIRTTLLEGKVKVSATPDSRLPTPDSRLLLPGQQAIASMYSPLTIDHSPNIDEVMAWKNGLFNFNNADIQTVMRQIARWYDVEVVYEGKMSTEKFEGEIPRNSQLSEVFKILELSNVHFAIEGKKVIVKP